MSPITSVIITTFNYGRFVSRAIDSVLSQTVGPAEIIVVDDGSTDGTEEVLRSYDTRVRVVEKSNGGQASAFNAGISQSSGDLIAFLDADDWWERRKVEVIEGVYRKVVADGVAVSMLRHNLVVHTPEGVCGETPGITRAVVHRPRSCAQLLGGRFSVPTSGLIVTRVAATQIVPLPEEAFRIGADSYLYTFAPELGATIDVPDALGHYRIHGDNNYKRGESERLPLQLELELELLRAARLRGGNPYIPHSVFRLARELRAQPAELALSTATRVVHAAHAPASHPRRFGIVLRELLEAWLGHNVGRPASRVNVIPSIDPVHGTEKRARDGTGA